MSVSAEITAPGLNPGVAVPANRPHVARFFRDLGSSNDEFFRLPGVGPPPYLVYVAINMVNCKLYVGATSRGLPTRKAQHFLAARRGDRGAFYSAIRKHGSASFEFYIFATGRDWDHVMQIERDLIEVVNPEYNLTKGGEGILGYKRTAESVERSASKLRGRPNLFSLQPKSDSTKAKMADARRRWWANRDRNEALSERLRVNAVAAGKVRSRSVVCVSDGGKVFASLNEAARFYGIDGREVYRSCRNRKHKPSKCLKFRYAHEMQ
jgi:group I intron endonuclease